MKDAILIPPIGGWQEALGNQPVHKAMHAGAAN